MSKLNQKAVEEISNIFARYSAVQFNEGMQELALLVDKWFEHFISDVTANPFKLGQKELHKNQLDHAWNEALLSAWEEFRVEDNDKIAAEKLEALTDKKWPTSFGYTKEDYEADQANVAHSDRDNHSGYAA